LIIPDANLLIYATDDSCAQHRRAHTRWEGVLNGTESVGLAWVCLLAVLRIMTNPKIFASPVPVADLLDAIQTWVESPSVTILRPDEHHLQALRALASAMSTRAALAGNTINDAHLAALALRHHGVVYSADRDFARFPGLRCVNPL